MRAAIEIRNLPLIQMLIKRGANDFQLYLDDVEGDLITADQKSTQKLREIKSLFQSYLEFFI